MTPDELQGLVLAGASVSLVDALAPLDETARRMLSKRAFELFQAAQDYERKTELSRQMADAGREASRNAHLAVLACCDGVKARRSQLSLPDEGEGILPILVARRPAWIDGWIKLQIDKRWVPGNWWPIVRGLVRAGIASKPAAATYINLMVSGIAWRNWRNRDVHVPLSTLLLEDKDLLETEIWQLFETENRAFVKDYVAVQRKRPQGHETWTEALIRLANEGHIDRARLIDAALNGMASGLKPAAIAGFVNFAEALAMSTEELSRRQAMLCQLLANQTGTAVSFALKALNRLERARLLERDRLLETIEPALLFPKKTQATAAVALLGVVAKCDETRRARCLLAAARALSNLSGEVQRRATDLIETYAVNSDGPLRESVGAQIGSVAPTIRDRLSALSQDGEDRAEVPRPGHLDVIAARVSRLPANLVQRWGITGAIDGWRAGKAFEAGAPIASDETDYQPVAPIASPDELLEAIALAVESVSGADEVERLIDGAARFADRRPDSKVAETIFKRFLAPGSSKGLTSSMGVPPQLVKLVGSWFGVDVTGRSYHAPESWWTSRFAPYQTALRVGRAWQPLSTPTHAGGWIDPRVWVARLNASGGPIDDGDGVQSLLRLAPFGRVEARKSMGRMPGAWDRLAEYALGGECRVGMTDVFRSPLWVAAGRARQPTGDLKELGRLLGVSNVPDALHESRFSLVQKVGKTARRRQVHDSESTHLPLDAMFDADVNVKMDDIPQCLFYPRKATQRFSLEWVSPWVIEWKSQIWPANLRGFLYWGINRMLQRFESSSSVYEPNYVYADSLRPHQRFLGDVEYMALAIACMSGEQEVRRSAGEVLVRAGVEGRLDARSFATILEELYAKGWFSINRLATTLGLAARDSPQTARLVVAALFTFLTHQKGLPKGAHDLLDVLYQQSHRLGISVPETFRERLLDQKGDTKTARLAKDLLDLQESASRADTAALEAINRLLERAESTIHRA